MVDVLGFRFIHGGEKGDKKERERQKDKNEREREREREIGDRDGLG